MSTRDPLRVISLGAGVQSSAMFLMACHGEIAGVDAAIFADTQQEPASVRGCAAYERATAESDREGTDAGSHGTSRA